MFILINSADHHNTEIAKALKTLKHTIQPTPNSELTFPEMKALQVSKTAGLNFVHMQNQHKERKKVPYLI